MSKPILKKASYGLDNRSGLPKGTGKCSLVLIGMNMLTNGSPLLNIYIAGFDRMTAKVERNLLCSSSVGGGISTWLDVASHSDLVGWILHLISEIVVDCTLFNSGGITQLAFLSVTLSDSLIRTPASIAHSNDAAWEHVLPRPAMQVQCTYSYYSSCTFSEYPWNKWLLVPTLQMAHLCVKRQTEDHMCSY